MKRVLLDKVLMIRSEAFIIVKLDTHAMKRSSIFIFILIFIYGSLTAQAQKPERQGPDLDRSELVAKVRTQKPLLWAS